ncbi:TetR/AcrR family transcriptional regulator [Niastella populi]|uniref:TetR family transcriptional regulator n=1 Tax=Niastella populi TaxID=550983 RepID=A0A1V9ETD8_9BACT|nr:TetR/AcrR family transcriptional regulator [Niastella populi]OQP49427.1 TetR family transcriptional regulator [Niastella populi]
MDKELKSDKSAEQKILDAAKQIFMENGLDGARMQDIADKAGINKALLHYYFRSKDKLFERIFTEEAQKFMPKVTTIMLSELPLFEKIEKFMSEYIDTLSQNPLLANFILNEIHRNPKEMIKKIWGSHRPPIEKVEEHVAKLVKKGEIRPIKGYELMINMVSLCIFPFLARPMVQWITKTNDDEFMKMMQQRKKTVVQFVIDSIKK